MKSVEEKYCNMYNNLVALYNSLTEEVEDENKIPISNDVFIAMNVLADFLEMYKKTNKLDYITESTIDEDENIIFADPSVWKSVMPKGSVK